MYLTTLIKLLYVDLDIFKLIGALALLMFGMKSMSDSLQKMAGPQLRHVLGI